MLRDPWPEGLAGRLCWQSQGTVGDSALPPEKGSAGVDLC